MRTDDILDQIDTALHDHFVSGDAMRSRPAPEPAGRSLLIRRLVDNHGLDHDDARATVIAFEQGDTSERTALVQAEARAVANEMMQRIRDAFRPMVEAANATLKRINEALKALPDGALDPHRPGRRTDRPAWQSPYGPARRRH